jgi:hypothetical protein
MPIAMLVASSPPVGWLVLVLGVYAAVLVPIVFWGLGRTGHRGAAWVILPLLALITTVGLWLYVHQQVTS